MSAPKARPADEGTSLATLAWLVRRRVAGRFRRTLRRIRKSPRHLLVALPVLYPLIYFALVFRDVDRPETGVVVTAPLFVFLGLLAVLRPLFRADGAQAIAFTGDEVQWLATAPISRPRLLAYAVLRAAPPLVYFGLYWSLLMWLSGIRAALPGMVAGLFVYGLTLTLLSMGSEMLSALLARWGIRATARRIVLGAGLLALAYFGSEPFRGGSPPMELDALADWVRERADRSVASTVLAPFVLLATLPTTTEIELWVPRVAGVIAADALLFIAIAKMPVPLEELALAGMRRMERAKARLGVGRGRVAPQRRSKRLAERAGPRLAAAGPPWRAVVWMAFVGAWRRIRPSPLLLVLLGGALVAAIVTDQRELAAVVGLTLVLLGLFLTLMATAITDPLRSTLSGLVTHLGALRGWPIGGATLARGLALGGGLALSIGASTVTVVSMLLLPRTLDVEWVVVSLTSGLALVPLHIYLVAVRDGIAVTWPELHEPGADLGAVRSANVIIGLLRAVFFFVGAGLAGGIGVGAGIVLGAVLGLPLAIAFPVAVVITSIGLLVGTEVFVRWSERRLRLD